MQWARVSATAFGRANVQTAPGRIDAGTFGVCAGCDRNIDPKRLAAVPWASSCIACQRAAEYGRALAGESHGSLGLAAERVEVVVAVGIWVLKAVGLWGAITNFRIGQ
jgi:hypothetical protein